MEVSRLTNEQLIMAEMMAKINACGTAEERMAMMAQLCKEKGAHTIDVPKDLVGEERDAFIEACKKSIESQKEESKKRDKELQDLKALKELEWSEEDMKSAIDASIKSVADDAVKRFEKEIEISLQEQEKMVQAVKLSIVQPGQMIYKITSFSKGSVTRFNGLETFDDLELVNQWLLLQSDNENFTVLLQNTKTEEIINAAWNVSQLLN
jgi:hypothetical protein